MFIALALGFGGPGVGAREYVAAPPPPDGDQLTFNGELLTYMSQPLTYTPPE